MRRCSAPLGIEPGPLGWKAKTKPLRYGGPHASIVVVAVVVIVVVAVVVVVVVVMYFRMIGHQKFQAQTSNFCLPSSA